MSDSPQGRSCGSCGVRSTCALLPRDATLRALAGMSGVPLPMPCGGDLWQVKVRRRLGGGRLFAEYNPTPGGASPPPAGGAGSLDQIELP